MTRRVTKAQGEKALKIVAAWLGPQLGYGDKPAPTGRWAAMEGLGPELNMAWDWPSGGPTPTVMYEGGPDDWALRIGEEMSEDFAKIGVWVEPYASYALCLYPDESGQR